MATIPVSKGHSWRWLGFVPSPSTAPTVVLGLWWPLSTHLWSDRKNEYMEGTLFFLERVEYCEGREEK